MEHFNRRRLLKFGSAATVAVITATTVGSEPVRAGTPSIAISIAGAVPLNVFQAGQTTQFIVGFDTPAAQPDVLTYTVRSFWQATVHTGTVQVPAGAMSTTISLPSMASGHYSITVNLDGDAPISADFAVVLPRTVFPDSPVAMDVAGSWYVPDDPDAHMINFANVLRLSGVTWIRDRIGWQTVNTARDQFTWSNGHTDEWAQRASAAGLKISMMYGEAPVFTHPSGNKLPLYLQDTYNWAKNAAIHYSGRVQTWEVMNESNAGSWTTANETADQYAAVLKAAAIGYADSGVAPLVALAGMAGSSPTPSEQWIRLMLENQVLDYASIYNYHLHKIYDPTEQPATLLAGVSPYISLKDDYDSSAPDWLTEAGIRFPGSTGRRLTVAEQQAQARYHVRWVTTSLAQGTDRHFVYLAVPIDSGTGQVGLFGPDFTPYAGYSAIAAMTAALGEGKYRGTVPGLPSTATGYVFADGPDSVLVLWGNSSTTTTVTIGLSQTTASKTNIMGQSSQISRGTNGYTLTLSSEPIYLRVVGTVPVNNPPGSAPTYQPKVLSPAKRVVLLQQYPAGVSTSARTAGYRLPTNSTTTVAVKIYNFNSTVRTGSIVGTVQGGWQLTQSTLPVTVAADGVATVNFSIQATAAVQPGVKLPVTFVGQFADGQTSPTTTLITAATT